MSASFPSGSKLRPGQPTTEPGPSDAVLVTCRRLSNNVEKDGSLEKQSSAPGALGGNLAGDEGASFITQKRFSQTALDGSTAVSTSAEVASTKKGDLLLPVTKTKSHARTSACFSNQIQGISYVPHGSSSSQRQGSSLTEIEGAMALTQRGPLHSTHMQSLTSFQRIMAVSPEESVPELPVNKPSLNSTGLFCRICHEGDSREELVAPCSCSGTVGLVHVSCIEKWLSSSNRDKCEICQYTYVTNRQPKPFREWLRTPSSRDDSRNLAGDVVCFLLLTPLALISAYLCAVGALHYLRENRVEASGLVCLCLFLLGVYFVWLFVTFRYHWQVWQKWRETNQNVCLIQLKRFSQSEVNLNSDDNNNVCNSPPQGPSIMDSVFSSPDQEITQENCHRDVCSSDLFVTLETVAVVTTRNGSRKEVRVSVSTA